MKTLTLGAAAVAAVLFLAPASALSHCQVPCGIYDDSARVHALLEDAVTIEKAMRLIGELADHDDPQSLNQLTRWINTKETHAANVIAVVSEYFLTQKVKPVDGKGRDAYLESLADHHAVMRAAMKCKQTVDRGNVESLREAIQRMARHYEVAHDHHHH